MSIIRQFLRDVVWGELDYLVVDLPPGTGDASLTLVQEVPLSGGVVVTTVSPGRAAEKAGLRRGDVIVELNRRPVTDAPAFYGALAALRPGESTLLYVHRPAGGGRNEYVVLERTKQP